MISEDFDIFEWAVIITFTIVIVFCGIALLYEYYGPTEQKEINGVLGQQYNIITNSNLPNGKFISDGGAVYRISDPHIIWYLLPDFGNDYGMHMTKNVTLRTTLQKVINHQNHISNQNAWIAVGCLNYDKNHPTKLT
jgi:hypothetical protein